MGYRAKRDRFLPIGARVPPRRNRATALTIGRLAGFRKEWIFFTISYSDPSKTTQVVVLEVPKDEPKVLLPILRARASQACGKVAANFCGGTLPH